MKEYIIEVDVDEDIVCASAGTADITEAIKAEAGWMHDSGIFVTGVSKKLAREELKRQFEEELRIEWSLGSLKNRQV